MSRTLASRAGDYVEMTRPRIIVTVAITATWGYLLGTTGGAAAFSWLRFLTAMIALSLAAAGGTVLNHYLERDLDARMRRTSQRPLAAGRLHPSSALAFGLLLVLCGVCLMAWRVNLLAAFLVLLSDFLYVLVYTPMKRVSVLNTTLGAIPGALPPLIGWAASAGRLETGGWLLFAMLFVWQHPHTYAIGWMHRDDYIRAGFRMLSVTDESGQRTGRAVVAGTLVLLAVSAGPLVTGLSSVAYATAAGVMGAVMLVSGLRLASAHSVAAARRVLKVSVIYLPLVLIGMLVDAWLKGG